MNNEAHPTSCLNQVICCGSLFSGLCVFKTFMDPSANLDQGSRSRSDSQGVAWDSQGDQRREGHRLLESCLDTPDFHGIETGLVDKDCTAWEKEQG